MHARPFTFSRLAWHLPLHLPLPRLVFDGVARPLQRHRQIWQRVARLAVWPEP